MSDAKEKLRHIELDYDTEMKSTAENFDKKETHEHPEHNTITVDTDRSYYLEVLSQPNFIGKVADGTHDKSYLNIMKYTDEIQRDFTWLQMHRQVVTSFVVFFLKKKGKSAWRAHNKPKTIVRTKKHQQLFSTQTLRTLRVR